MTNRLYEYDELAVMKELYRVFEVLRGERSISLRKLNIAEFVRLVYERDSSVVGSSVVRAYEMIKFNGFRLEDIDYDD